MTNAQAANQKFEGVRIYQVGGYEYLTTYFEAKFKGTASAFGVADQFTAFLAQYAQYGYEYFRTDEIPYSVQPGCLAGLLGGKVEYGRVTIATFRKRL